MAMAAGVRANIEAEDDRSRMAAGHCSRVFDRRFFPGVEQARLGAPESRLLASAYLTASLSH
jgi:hypothetical protein